MFLIGLVILLHYRRSPLLKVSLQRWHTCLIRRAQISSVYSEAWSLRHREFGGFFFSPNILHPYISPVASPAHQICCSLSESTSPHLLKDPWALKSQWEFIIHRYHCSLHSVIQKDRTHSAGHFFTFSHHKRHFKTVKQHLTNIHHTLVLGSSPHQVPPSQGSQCPRHIAPLLPSYNQAKAWALQACPPPGRSWISSLPLPHLGISWMKAGTWKHPKGRWI